VRDLYHAVGDTAPMAACLEPSDPLNRLRGVGDKLAARLEESLGLRVIEDLILCFPRRHREIHEILEPELTALDLWVRIAVRITGVRLAWLPGRRSLVTISTESPAGAVIDIRFFNQPYLKKTYAVGKEYLAEGVLEQVGEKFCLKQPRLFPSGASRSGSLLLSYPEISGISEARFVGLIEQALARVDLADWSYEEVPPAMAKDLPSFADAVRGMHVPASADEHLRARHRFAILEAAGLFRRVEKIRRARLAHRGPEFAVDSQLERRILEMLPFDLTGDQAAALQKIWRLMQGPAPMGVLLQGDVATGKTIVAWCVAMSAVTAGWQVAFLAPTELLAEQHHQCVQQLCRSMQVPSFLLTASSEDRLRTARLLESGDPCLVFGTHALFSADTTFSKLGLVIIDEQHRFGVEQRASLIRKGDNPHVLYMTATPIPRTLTLTLFGDLDLAVLRQRPPGHRPASAFYLPPSAWRRVIKVIGRRIARGEQVFVVCPKIGMEGEKGGAVRLHEELLGRFESRLVHGQMDSGERQANLDAFRSGEFPVLVGTTVLEVGVDVPNATLMVVVGCDRFGLATLHQLRGRVGRGAKRGLCIMTGAASARTRAVCRTVDGFDLAEQDLALRGSGELAGKRQSGLSELRALDPVVDLDILSEVRDLVRLEHYEIVGMQEENADG
jgi:ATP-dependent DNA helicase RecG